MVPRPHAAAAPRAAAGGGQLPGVPLCAPRLGRVRVQTLGSHTPDCVWGVWWAAAARPVVLCGAGAPVRPCDVLVFGWFGRATRLCCPMRFGRHKRGVKRVNGGRMGRDNPAMCVQGAGPGRKQRGL